MGKSHLVQILVMYCQSQNSAFNAQLTWINSLIAMKVHPMALFVSKIYGKRKPHASIPCFSQLNIGKLHPDMFYSNHSAIPNIRTRQKKKTIRTTVEAQVNPPYLIWIWVEEEQIWKSRFYVENFNLLRKALVE